MAKYRNFTVDVKWDHKKFAEVIISAAKASTAIMATDMRMRLKRDADIAVYEDKGGPLSYLLEHTGLDTSTIPGSLQNGFYTMVEGIRPKHFKYQSIMPVLNEKTLNDATVWYGVANYWRRGEPVPPVVEGGLRPLPGSNKKFRFVPNPYSGKGYWYIQEVGYQDNGINYPGTFQIRRAFRNVFDKMNPALPGDELWILKTTFKKKWERTINQLVNNSFR